MESLREIQQKQEKENQTLAHSQMSSLATEHQQATVQKQNALVQKQNFEETLSKLQMAVGDYTPSDSTPVDPVIQQTG